MVYEFCDLFPKKLPSLPPQREIDFETELIPYAQPILKALYRMTPIKFKELRIQLDELLQKGFIRPSVSPWEAPVLFVKQKKWDFKIVYRLQGVKQNYF